MEMHNLSWLIWPDSVPQTFISVKHLNNTYSYSEPNDSSDSLSRDDIEMTRSLVAGFSEYSYNVCLFLSFPFLFYIKICLEIVSEVYFNNMTFNICKKE